MDLGRTTNCEVVVAAVVVVAVAVDVVAAVITVTVVAAADRSTVVVPWSLKKHPFVDRPKKIQIDCYVGGIQK